MISAILTKEQVEANPGTKIVLDWFKQTYGVDLPVKPLGEQEADVSAVSEPMTEQSSTESDQ